SAPVPESMLASKETVRLAGDTAVGQNDEPVWSLVAAVSCSVLPTMAALPFMVQPPAVGGGTPAGPPPVPVSDTSWVPTGSSVPSDHVAEAAPATVGANRTCSVNDWPAAMPAPSPSVVVAVNPLTIGGLE